MIAGAPYRMHQKANSRTISDGFSDAPFAGLGSRRNAGGARARSLRAVAGALLNFAALNPVNDWRAGDMDVPRRDAQVDESDIDTDLEYSGRMAGW